MSATFPPTRMSPMPDWPGSFRYRAQTPVLIQRVGSSPNTDTRLLPTPLNVDLLKVQIRHDWGRTACPYSVRRPGWFDSSRTWRRRTGLIRVVIVEGRLPPHTNFDLTTASSMYPTMLPRRCGSGTRTGAGIRCCLTPAGSALPGATAAETKRIDTRTRARGEPIRVLRQREGGEKAPARSSHAYCLFLSPGRGYNRYRPFEPPTVSCNLHRCRYWRV